MGGPPLWKIVMDCAALVSVHIRSVTLAKGQIISECPFEILDFPKIPRKI